MLWHLRPIGLMQVLADVLRFRVVLGVPLHGGWPVVGSPEDVETGFVTAACPSAKAGEQVDCSVHIKSLYHARSQGCRGSIIEKNGWNTVVA